MAEAAKKDAPKKLQPKEDEGYAALREKAHAIMAENKRQQEQKKKGAAGKHGE